MLVVVGPPGDVKCHANDIRVTRPQNHPDAVHDDATLTLTKFIVGGGGGGGAKKKKKGIYLSVFPNVFPSCSQ